MKKVFLFFGFLTILFTAFKVNVYALGDTCTDAEKIRLRELVAATKMSYEFFEIYDKEMDVTTGYYDISISNFTPDFYVYNEEYAIMFKYLDSSIVTDGRYYGGVTYYFPFYASSKSPCKDYLIATKNVYLIPFNHYSKDSLCKGYENYELCKKFTPIKISSQTEFEQRVKQYIGSLKSKEEVKKEIIVATDENMWSSITAFFVKNYMYILVGIIITGTLSIIIIEIKKRRRIL
jgi:hypothetical protein